MPFRSSKRSAIRQLAFRQKSILFCRGAAGGQTNVGSEVGEIDDHGLSGLFEGYEKSIRPALDAVDEVRPYVKDIPEIASLLPAIVVIGEQSAGKSSLLESISGIALPRGSGMCTKVPLELQLRKSDTQEKVTMEYVSAGAKEVKKSDISFENITKEIDAATINIVGKGKVIKDQPITLRICGPKMKDLTLIDLPGITRASNSTETFNVEEQTTEMIKKYVESESKVIVCALAANVDFSNSGALKIAQQVDPEGKRTLGVATKIDTYERGTKIIDKVHGSHPTEVSLRLGYVAVRCRTNVELEAGMSLDDLHAEEQRLLTSDQELKHIKKERKSTPVLIKKLVSIQRNRLKEKIPDLIAKIEEAIHVRERDLEELRNIPENSDDCFLQLVMAANEVSSIYKDQACVNTITDTDIDIRYLIYQRIEGFKSQILGASVNVFTDTVFQKVKTLCGKKRSSVLSNFLSPTVFTEVYATEFLLKYVEPSNKLIEDAHKATTEVLHQIVAETLGTKLANGVATFTRMVDNYFAAVKSKLEEITLEEILMHVETFSPLTSAYDDNRRRLASYQTEYAKYRDANSTYRHTHHNEFAFNEAALLCCNEKEQKWMQNFVASSNGDSTKSQSLEMMNSIAAYLKTVCDVTLDTTPKRIMRKFVAKPCEDGAHSLRNFMIAGLREEREDLFEMIFDPSLISKRDRLQQEHQALKQSKIALKRAMHIA